MHLRLDVTKTVEENAAEYYEKSKKLKRKLEGMQRTIGEMQKRIEREEEKEALSKKLLKRAPPEWYEKFRWMKVEGFLVIGGSDATQNEVLVKKYMEPKDIFFHADLHGAPAVIVKTEGKNVSKEALERIADFSFSYSSAWKAGHGSGKVYWVKGTQASLNAPAGEFRAKGGIIISGERNYLPAKSGIEIGLEDGRLVAGYALKEPRVKIALGEEKKTDVAKKIRKTLLFKLGAEYGNIVSLDGIVKLLPGPCKITG